jgi:hypothetical protein
MKERYFETGFTITTFVENAEIDYASYETQRTMYEFADRYNKCYNC